MCRLKKETTPCYRYTDVLPGRDADVIYVLNTPEADAILLQSCGRFALVDAAEDTGNARKLRYFNGKGYEWFVLAYLKRVCGDAQGKVHLDWFVGTHCHSDHLGGLDTLLDDPDVTLDRAYLKRYRHQYINRFERAAWDNQELFDQTVQALKRNNVEWIADLTDEPFQWGNMQIRFHNEKYKTQRNVGENNHSLGIEIVCHGYKAFLAGDINNARGDETRIGKKLGKVHFLKIGHHGHIRSTTWWFVHAIRPECAALTNQAKDLNPFARLALRSVGCQVFAAANRNGVAVTFTPQGLLISDNLHTPQELALHNVSERPSTL